MAPKPRVLHVIDHSDSGGAQAQMSIRMADLQKQYDFSVVVLGRTGKFSNQYRELGIPTIELGGKNHRWSLGVFFPLLKLVRREKPDIIHAHLFKSMALSPLVAWLTDTPCILNDDSGINRQSLGFYFPNTFIRLFFTWVLHLAAWLSSKIVVLTNSNKSDYIQAFNVPETKVEILPNSIDIDPSPDMVEKVDLRRELKLSGDARIILMVGRLSPEKDWPTFLEVAGRFPDPDRYAFVVIGSGRMKASLHKMVSNKNPSNVHFLGERMDVPLLLAQGDAFLLTSRQEAFGNVILEAMVAGCPVISSRTPGASSIIKHEKNGLLVEVGDVDGFASYLDDIFDDPLMAENLVHNASLSLAQYAPDKVSSELAGIYAQVLKDRVHRLQ